MIPAFLTLLAGIFLATTEIHATEVLRWQPDMKAAQQEAAMSGKLVIAHFTSDNCLPCLQMQQEVFTRQDVASVLQASFVIVNINSTKDPAMAKAMQVRGTPCDVILSPEGKMLHRREGAIKAERYIDYMNWITARIPLPQPTPVVASQVPSSQTAAQPATSALSAQSTHSAPPAFPPSAAASEFTPIPTTPSPWPTAPAANPAPGVASALVVDRVGATATSGPFPQDNITLQPQAQTAVPAQETPLPVPAFEGRPPLPMPVAAQEIPGMALVSEPAPKVASSAMSASLTPSMPIPGSMTVPQMPLHPDPPTETPSVPSVATVEVPLGLDGYCPVALVRKEAWVPGNPLYFAMFRGQIFRLESEEALECFHAEPYRYAPVAGGNDIVYMADRNKKLPGQRSFGISYNERVYLFSGKETFDLFAARPEYYSGIAEMYETALRSHFDKVQR